MATAHIESKKEDIAKTVLMPGDPLRAQFIAKTYLTDYKLVNEVRGILAYTGMYKNKKVTVMASGMGMPSIGIYSYELFNEYDVEEIIRIGSFGSYTEDINLYDIMLVEESYSNSSFALIQNGTTDNIIPSNNFLNQKIKETAKKLSLELHVGRIYSSDVFYTEKQVFEKYRNNHGCSGVEMESFALFHNARVLNKKATCLLTCSDSFITHEVTTSEERQNSFTKMMELALESIV